VSTGIRKVTDPLLTGLAVFGGIVSILTLWPRTTVTIDFDTRNPLASSFLVSNDGFLPVYSVSTSCLLGEVLMEPNQPSQSETQGTEPLGSELINSDPPLVTLAPGAKESVPFSNCINGSPGAILSFAHVGLRVSYKPLFWPSRRSFAQQFYARHTAEGNYYWYSFPYTK
jgi:hypothetical protein